MRDDPTTRWNRLDSLFDAALEVPSAERERFARTAAGDDAELLAELQAMLAAVGDSDPVLDGSALDAIRPVAPAGTSRTGEQLGPWRLLGLIGSGGMGEVYAAKRADGAFDSEVAVKFVRAGVLRGVARFLAERRILAGLRHPGIARLYDAGIAADGAPYMVIEKVDGVPITRWCAARHSPLDERLRLFLQVCDAVEHAHRNLIVHRDLKPANILVDDSGRVVLLDFGVARRLVPDAPHTADAPLTLAYAAPEQVEGGAITTATDVFALGAILFELLTGSGPRAGQAALSGFVEALLKRDAEPPSVVAARGADPPVPPQQLRGDLDAIVAKALRVAADARYPTVADLRADLERYLRGEAVRARGSSRAYRASRFLHRHRWSLAAAGGVLAALAAGLAGTLWQAREAARERDLARIEAARSDAVRDYVMLMFREAGASQGSGELTARQVLERSATRLAALPAAEAAERARLVQLLGELYMAIDDFEGAAPVFRSYLAGGDPAADPDVLAEIRHDLAIAETRLGNFAAARELLAQAQSWWNRDPRRHRDLLATSRVVESQLQRQAGAVDAAIATLRAALAERTAISGEQHAETAYAANALALALLEAGQAAEADQQLTRALETLTALGKQESAVALTMLSNRGVAAMHLGDPTRAAALFERAVDLRRRLYGRSAGLAALQHNLGRIMTKTGRVAQARQLLVEARDMAAEFNGATSPMVLTMDLSIADANLLAGDLAAAQSTLDGAREAIRATLGDSHVLLVRGDQLLGRLRIAQRRWPEAESAIADAQRRLDALGSAGNPYLPEMAALRAALAAARGDASVRP